MQVLDHAVVATDSDRVARVCRDLGAPVEMTSSDHPSGTDRIAAAEAVNRDAPDEPVEFRAGETRIWSGWSGHRLRDMTTHWKILVKQVNLIDYDQNLRTPSIVL